MYAQDIYDDDIDKLIALDQKLAALHVDYESIRPLFFNRLAFEFADQLDPDALLLTVEEIDELKTELPEIKRESKQDIQHYLNNVSGLMRKKREWLERKLNSVKAYDFFEPDSIFFQASLDTQRFATDTIELNNTWKKYLKLRTLQKSSRDSLLHTRDKSEINASLNADLEKIIQEELCKLKSNNSNLSDAILTGFLRSYAKSFDPHSDYFSTKTKDRFLTSLSSEMYSTGLIFEYDGSKFIITKIIPFSSASNYEYIKVGDEIVSIQLNNEWTSLHCLSDNEISSFFYGQSDKFINLEIRSSTDKTHRNFQLKKDILANVSNHIYKFLLQKDDMNIGYVLLPSFYSNIVSGTGSAGQDLAVVLLDLNNRDLDGLIIDLRSNAGGSMQEAIDLSGFFIDYGPLFITTTKESYRGQLYKDTKRGRIFKGKVVFMVNSFSASASELVVSALRYYPDQLIVGSPTFGKSTSQILTPLFISNQQRPFGMAKITTSRMYNIRGSSYQGVGVQPDIELPSFPTKKLVGESSYQYRLENKPISKSFNPIQPRKVPVDDLRKAYKSRLARNTTLQQLTNKYDSLEEVYTKGVYFSLNYQQFKNYKPSTTIEETNISFGVETLEEDATFQGISEQLEENAMKDPILNEVFRIFGDWITINEN